ncbi:cupin domain-containing protein [Sutterella wadsworthensis]|uniref:cupin domain-containing protein n=1 Tax=Sutterella wadsworthensis TaxID=40545 RepID=UPI00396722B3
MDALSQILAALSVKSYTATGVRGGGFSIAYPAYPGMKLLVPRKGKMYFMKKASSAPDSALSDAGHASAGSSALSEAQSTLDWIELLPGSLLLMVKPTSFIFTDDPKLEPHLSAQTPYELRGGLADYGIKPGYEENILLAGKMTLDPTAAAQLRAALPPLLILKPKDNEADRLGWMMKMLHEEVESSEPGSSLVTTHLMQLVLIEVIRCWIHSPEAKNHPGIFLALRQPTLFRALSAIHNAPEKPWTVETLARAAGMSR